MNYKIQQKIADALGEGNKYVSTPGVFLSAEKFGLMSAEPFASQYMLKGTLGYYNLATSQFSVEKNGEVDEIGTHYQGVLNGKGWEFFKEINDKYIKAESKGVLDNWDICYENSGMWGPDETSEFYDPEDCLSLNSCNNVHVRAMLNGKNIMTSPIIFYTTEWCYTKSGSLYEFGNKK